MLPQVNLIRAKNADFLCFWESAGISGVLTAHGVWDELTIHLAKVLIDRTPSTPIILDVGANMGTFSIPIAKHIEGRSGLVHSFEPQRIVYYQLCGNVFLNRIDNVYTHNVALSDVDQYGHVKPLDYTKSWNIGAYSLGADNRDGQERGASQERISFVKLDDFGINPEITLIKIDVEGMELEVLKGGMKSIHKAVFRRCFLSTTRVTPRVPWSFSFL